MNLDIAKQNNLHPNCSAFTHHPSTVLSATNTIVAMAAFHAKDRLLAAAQR